MSRGVLVAYSIPLTANRTVGYPTLSDRCKNSEGRIVILRRAEHPRSSELHRPVSRSWRSASLGK